MLAVDTNVLVRFLVEDDAAQTEAAARLLARAASRQEQLFVSDVTLCELVWVLLRSYEFLRPTVAHTLGLLLRAQHLAFYDSDLLARAVAAFTKGKGDFADYVIREHAVAAGYPTVATFDRALLREPGFLRPTLTRLAGNRGGEPANATELRGGVGRS